MEEKETCAFSWSGLFIVTACCSFLFSAITKLLDGSHSGLLLITGSIAAAFGLLNWIGRMADRQFNKKRGSNLVS